METKNQFRVVGLLSELPEIQTAAEEIDRTLADAQRQADEIYAEADKRVDEIQSRISTKCDFLYKHIVNNARARGIVLGRGERFRYNIESNMLTVENEDRIRRQMRDEEQSSLLKDFLINIGAVPNKGKPKK